MAKKRVVVLYGGRADEHSISCISTAGVLWAMDTERFEPIPVGITKDGKWIINGEDPRGWNLDGGELPTVKITPESRPVMLDPSRGQDGFFIGEPSHINSADSGFGTSFVSMSDPEMHHVLTSLGHVDAVLPVLHGPYGEVGTGQSVQAAGRGCGIGAGNHNLIALDLNGHQGMIVGIQAALGALDGDAVCCLIDSDSNAGRNDDGFSSNSRHCLLPLSYHT